MLLLLSFVLFTVPLIIINYQLTVSYCMAGNIGVKLYLAVGEMKPVLPNFNPPTEFIV